MNIVTWTVNIEISRHDGLGLAVTTISKTGEWSGEGSEDADPYAATCDTLVALTMGQIMRMLHASDALAGEHDDEDAIDAFGECVTCRDTEPEIIPTHT